MKAGGVSLAGQRSGPALTVTESVLDLHGLGQLKMDCSQVDQVGDRERIHKVASQFPGHYLQR